MYELDLRKFFMDLMGRHPKNLKLFQAVGLTFPDFYIRFCALKAFGQQFNQCFICLPVFGDFRDGNAQDRFAVCILLPSVNGILPGARGQLNHDQRKFVHNPL